jgi:acyl transferase domain-containing protein/acyl carrier protein
VRQALALVREDEPGDKRLVAYVVANEGAPADLPEQLRVHLRQSLPEYMIPAAFVTVDKFPLTSNGKVDQAALPAPREERQAGRARVAPRSGLEERIAAVFREILRVEEVGVDDNFFDLGGHSLLLVKVHNRLREAFDQDLSIVELFEYPTVEALAGRLGSRVPGERVFRNVHDRIERRKRRSGGYQPIAIVGMAGRYPGARDPEALWRNIRDGKEFVTAFSDEEMRAQGVSEELLGKPDYVKSGVVLEEVEMFDAQFFGYTPREGQLLDPQQRVFLECAWEALENAGHDPSRFGGAIGVFAGIAQNSYQNLLSADPALSGFLTGVDGMIASDKDFLATRVSYKLGLKGPSLTVQTACSTSLVAVHVAARSLQEFECDMAMAGGVSIMLPQGTGYLYHPEGIGSPDGHCRAFDAKAGGTMLGNGASIVVLRRLEDALADGDTIHAVITGSAINNDGAGKVGFTAPSVEGQAEVIAAAHAEAAVDPATIGYVEAHGTGTRLGDPVEVAALTRAFRAGTDRSAYCALGSIKTNLGHLNTAAGCTGLIKAALAVRDGVLPPSLHFEEPNPEIDFASTPFYVNASLAQWKAELRPRRAGVSSFGIGGTNAHVVLEEAPPAGLSGGSRRWQILVLSARTQTALDSSARRLAARLEEHRAHELADMAYTLQVGRREFDYRAFALCRDAGEAREILAETSAQRLQRGRVQGKARPVVFMFTGQGSQYPGMGEGLYRDDALYRQVVDECCELLQDRAGVDLKAALFPAKGQDRDAAERLRDTRFAQPALFVTEYALARRWMAWGVGPEAMIGHSVGEYVAACLAGVMSLEDALLVVATRGRLVSGLEGGAMLAVPLGEPDLQFLLGESLSIAAVNSPHQCVVSGPTPAVVRLESDLRGRGLEPVRLHASHAFHSKMMDPALTEFSRCVSQVRLHAPRMPYISNVTGTWVAGGQATDPQYWVDHLRQGVRFSSGMRKLLEDDARVFLEVGPGNTLAGIARHHLQPGAPSRVFSSLRSARESIDDEAHLFDALGRLWIAGVAVDWKSFCGSERRRRVPLPTYAFERQRLWPGLHREGGAAACAKKADIADWFYTRAWARSVIAPSSPGNEDRAGSYLVFVDHRGLGERLVQLLAGRGETVVEVRAAQRYSVLEPGRSYALQPASASDYAALFADLRASGRLPRHVLHVWGVEAVGEDGFAAQQRCQKLGFYSLLFLAQALGANDAPVRISVVTEGVHAVGAGDPVYPEKALVLGPCRVIPDEIAQITCRNVDVVLPDGDCQALAATLLTELDGAARETVVAYRGGERWTEVFQPLRLPARAGTPARLRHGGVYLITGGLGGIGLAVAGYLARSVQAKLVLVSRSPFPAPENWERWLVEHEGEDDATSRRIRKLRCLEADGAEVLVIAADVTNEREVRAAVARAHARFGRIRGVVHSAGLGGGGIIQLKTRADAAAVMSPKVEGTRVLERVLSKELDFIVLCSSLASILGGASRIEYCAANACLDAFPAFSRQRGGPPTIAINWDTWSEVGMAVQTELPKDLLAHRDRTLRLGITEEEGIEAFRRILDAEPALPQVIVSTHDLGGRLPARGARSELPLEPGQEAQGETVPAGDRQGTRPAHLSRPYAPPRSATEKTLAGIWQNLMGIQDIGADDDFFELGGHSLLAIQVLGRAGAALGVKVSLQEFFAAPTVAGLSSRIEDLSSRRGHGYGRMAALAGNLEQYSEDDIRRIVAESRAGGPGR